MRSEFDFIQNIKKKYGLKHVGDDCAVLPKDDKTDMVVTADMLVEDIDFRLDWTLPKFLGHKALAVSLSDIAAMGATPKWAMLTMGVPEEIWKSNLIEQVFDEYSRLANKFEVEIVGGDISKTPDKLVLDSIVGGDVPRGKAVLRSGATPGDGIYVTGSLGGSAAGLTLLQNGLRYGSANRIWENKLLLKHLQPYPRTGDGQLLRNLGVSSMIDISDGLSSDIAHICRESVVGAVVFADRIPIEKKINGLRVSREDQLDMSMNGGEDFELLFTADEKKCSLEKLAGYHRIGEVTANAGIIELIRNGKTQILEPKGYRHF